MRKEKFITIFTPTYNRADKLLRLYNSIKSQNCELLEWLIVDDGSTDNTKQCIDKLKKENIVDIKYIYKDNGGKHTAYNEGLKNAGGKLFFCVDSDDLLSRDAVNLIYEFWNSTKKSDKCCGIVAKKNDINNIYIMDDLPVNVGEISLSEMDRVYKCKGDKCFIFRTDIAKDFLFPIIEGERFFPESYVFDKIGNNYKFLMMNIVLNECEYLDDGYTNNFLMIMVNNPTGFKYYYSQRIDMAVSLLERIKYMVSYNEFSFMCRTHMADYNGRFKIAVNLLKVTGPAVYLFHRLRVSVANIKNEKSRYLSEK